MPRLIFAALLAILAFAMLPGVATNWLVQRGYIESFETTDAVDSAPKALALQTSESNHTVANYNGARRTVIKPGAGGHYFAQAHFENKTVRVIIDTGASLVALTADDARRLGFKPRKSDYNVKVNTASGVALYARSRVGSIRIGQVDVKNVDVLIAPKGALDITLMGMSYLRKLKTFKIERGRLILES